MHSPTALMGDGVQPGVLSSSTWVLRSDPKGGRDCSARLTVGPLPQSDLRNLCMIPASRCERAHLRTAITEPTSSVLLQVMRYFTRNSGLPLLS